MPPKAKALEQALVATAQDIFNSDKRGELSVNSVRKRVEDDFELESGFFTSANWKHKSKDIIKATVDDLFANEAAESSSLAKPKSEPTGSKNGFKRESSEDPVPPAKKRQKRESISPVSKKRKTVVKKNESSSELSDLSDYEDKKSSKKRKVGKRAVAVKTKRKAAPDSDDEESDGFKDEAKPDDEMSIKKDSESEAETKPKRRKSITSTKKTALSKSVSKKKKTVDSSDEDDQEEDTLKQEGAGDSDSKGRTITKDEVDSETERKTKEAKAESRAGSPIEGNATPPKLSVEKKEDDEDSPLSDIKDSFSDEDDPKKEEVEEKELKINYNSDSSMSVVYDEPPIKAKRGRKGKSTKTASEPKAAKGAAKKSGAGRKSAGGMDAASPDEAEIKKLQGQLVKCGVRKIWAFELKQHGDNAKAKIRHLKGMLRDIGMDGRFSEAKAREIKEMRELAADLEAVQEMDKSWGVGGRASRSRAAASKSKKTLKESGGSEADEDEKREVDGNGGSKMKKEGSDDEESGAEVKTFAKSRRLDKRHADLAFLGSESESD